MSDIWEDGVVVIAGEFTDGQMKGEIVMADFSENIIELDCGNGFHWRGTSQEFSQRWESI